MNQSYVAAVRGLTRLQDGLQADDAPRNSGPDFGKASPFGLLVVVLLLISVVFLIRSMNRHLSKVPNSFDTQNPALGKAQEKALDSDDQAGEADVDRPTKGHPDGRLPHEPDG